MPGYSKSENSLACKLVCSFENNQSFGIPSLSATIILFNGDTGKPKAVIEADAITGWRTAAATVVATKYMYKGPKNVLSILGSGAQGETHAQAMKHAFNFSEIRIWNRTKVNAEKLASKLPFDVVVCATVQDCVREADVICITISTEKPILKEEWIKKGVHINAIGVGAPDYSEIEESIYQKAYIVVDHTEAAEKELAFCKLGIGFAGAIGDYARKLKEVPHGAPYTIFHSLGMAIEDVAAANLVYNMYKNKKELQKKIYQL